MSAQIKLRRDTSTNWTTVNPVLSNGEPGIETDTRRIKFGNGSSAWNSLPYVKINYSDILNAPAVPSLVGYATETYVNTAVNNVIGISPAQLNTLSELAAALANDPAFAQNITTVVNGKANTADLAPVATSGDYNDLTNKPTGLDGTPGPAGPQGIQGIQGIQGETGPQGIQGETGPQGIQGAPGPQGSKGDTGAEGVAVTLQGTKALIADLPAAPVNPADFAGHGWIVTEGGGNLWFWDLATQEWDNVGTIVGPQGNPGIQGETGPQGETGSQGIQGIQGETGPQGIQGIQGQTGATGDAGAKGDTGDAGPKGDTGDAGPKGDTGAKGDTGDAGAIGINYRGVYDGGAVYLNNDVVTFQGSTYIMVGQNLGTGYDPIAYSGMWSIIAAAGADGADGADGTNGINGLPGNDGAPGAAGADGTNGIGVPVGGTAGQVLAKIDSDDYNTEWVTPSGGSGSAFDTIVSGGQQIAIADGTTQFELEAGNGITITSNIPNQITISTSVSYKGFRAHYGSMFDNTDDENGPINKLVIYKSTVTPNSAIDTDTSSDDFQVTGLSGSDVVAMLVVISDGTDWETQTPTMTLRTFVEAIIDNVILDGGVEGDVNSIANMKTAFYDNFSNFNTIIPNVKTDLEFFDSINNPQYNINNFTYNGTTGAGASFSSLQYVFNNSAFEVGGWGQNAPGGYVVGDTFTILGTDTLDVTTMLTLASPANDTTITITSIVGDGYINTFTVTSGIPVPSTPAPIWRSYSIGDGGDDEYDGGNAIHTDLATEIIYNDGNVVSNSSAFGGGDYVVTYQAGIFGVFATECDIDILGTSGDNGGYGNDNSSSGFDGDGQAVTGGLYNVESYSSLVNGDNRLVLKTNGTLTLPSGGTISEGLVTSNPTIQLTPANPDVASQKLVIKGGGNYNSTENGINLNWYVINPQVGDTVEIYVYSEANANQTLYWWIHPTSANIATPDSGTLTLNEGGASNDGPISFVVDSDDYEFTVRVSPTNNVYDSATIGVESLVFNEAAPIFGNHHLHLTTGDLTETSIFLGTDDQNVRTTVDGGIQITTPNTTNNVWEFDNNGALTLPEVPWNYVPTTFTSIPVTYGQTSLTFTVQPDNTIVNMSVSAGAGGYGPDDYDLTILGTTFPGGTSPANDIVFNVTTFETAGPVYSTSPTSVVTYVSGTPPSRYDNIASTSAISIGADGQHWTFGTNGGLTFPNSTVQTTAWTGSTTVSSLVNGAKTVSLSSSGNLTLPSGLTFRKNGTPYSTITADLDKVLQIETQTSGGVKQWSLGTDGSLTFPDETVQTTAYAPVTGSWDITTGTNTYSFTVPANGAYQLWVRCNIPNGIITYLATVSVTNTNVPVLGSQRAYNYTGGGSPILLVTMPTQIVGAEGTISTATISGTTNNVFNFVISNTSGETQTAYYGYTKI